ncbi:exonuclease domain-containing protein [Alcaligenes nematophilus]
MPTFVSLDVETANADMSSICQIGMCHFENGEVVDRWETLIDPQDYFDDINEEIHGITWDMVQGAPIFQDVHQEIFSRTHGQLVVTHTRFDRTALFQSYGKISQPFMDCDWLDSAMVARRAWPDVAQRGFGLARLAERCGIKFKHHNALEDAEAAGKVLIQALRESGQDLEWWKSRVLRPLVEWTVRQEGNPDGPLFGETVVFTGALSIPRRDAVVLAAQLGCNVVENVTKAVTMLVVGDQDVLKLAGHEKSSKHRKAEQLIVKGQEIRILRESDFISLMKG